MKRVFGGLLAVAVSLTVLSVASPAQAGKEDRRACVTSPEYRKIEEGMSRAELVRLLDGRGKSEGAKRRSYARCESDARVLVRFDRNFAQKKNVHVVAKRIVKPQPKPKPEPQAGSGGGGSHAPVSEYDCPGNAPIKGNASSMIYHPPASPWYDATKPEECFASESDAVAAGYRRAKY